jgi:dTDP-4-amino-4,6-dideoxygalactose transaminase
VVNKSLLEFVYLRGRVALYAILEALGVKKGDEIITQAFTCIAVPEAIIAVGAKPVYVDIKSNSVNMDVNDLQRKISSKTKAIIVQHTYGIPADIDNMIKITEEKNIPIIEDCCHTLMSVYKGKTVGTFGIGSFYSFEWGKPVIVGIGGSAVVNNNSLQKKLKLDYKNYELPSRFSQIRLRLQYIVHNILYNPSRYWLGRSLYHKMASMGIAEGNYNPIQEGEHKSQDYTLRMSEYHKKLLEREIEKIKNLTSHSKWIASQYRDRIKSNEVCHLKVSNDCKVIFAHYPLIARNKQKLLDEARKENIEVADWYSTPIHPVKSDQWPLIYYNKGSCPNAEKMSKQIVTLPTNKKVTEKDINRTIDFLNKVGI